jgi:uncharacterized protein YigE (DUF2233 family)
MAGLRAARMRQICFFLSTMLLSLAAAVVPARAAPDCEEVTEAGERYLVCTADIRRDEIRLYWADAEGQPYGSFAALAHAVAGVGARLLFATNGGMFDHALRPIGLYVEHGEQIVAANTRNGYGNFHLKPNGIFYVGDGVAGVMETERFLSEHPDAEYATQSGPMLVIDGAIHPRFLVDATSRKIRSGVGVKDGHTVIFALSEEGVTFYEFASLFRDRLGCDNALFLDGSVSDVYAPEVGRTISFSTFGPMIGIVDR